MNDVYNLVIVYMNLIKLLFCVYERWPTKHIKPELNERHIAPDQKFTFRRVQYVLTAGSRLIISRKICVKSLLECDYI